MSNEQGASAPDTSLPMIVYRYLAGNCPVQAEGTIHSQPFYFRARGSHWSLGIGDEPVGSPGWYWEEEYGSEPFAAGWMSEDEARAFIEQAAARYANGERQEPDPPPEAA